MVETVSVGGVGRAAERKVPFEKVCLEGCGGVVGRGSCREFLGFADWKGGGQMWLAGWCSGEGMRVLRVPLQRDGFRGGITTVNLRMRLIVGDLVLNFGVAMVADGAKSSD